jgi:hypothetical protein
VFNQPPCLGVKLVSSLEGCLEVSCGGQASKMNLFYGRSRGALFVIFFKARSYFVFLESFGYSYEIFLYNLVRPRKPYFLAFPVASANLSW